MASATFQTSTQTIVVGQPSTSSAIVQGTESPITTNGSATRSTATATIVYSGPVAPSAASSESVAATAAASFATSIQQTSVPALTTLFTPAPFCLSSVNLLSNVYQLAPTQLSACYPSPGTHLTYSPAICPSGYTVGLQNINVYQSASQESAFATETEFQCCPSLLTYNLQSLACVTVVNQAVISGNPPVLITPTDPFSSVIVWSTVPITASGTSASSSLPSYTAVTTSPFATDQATYTIQAPVFLARFQSTDSLISSSWEEILRQTAPTTSVTGSSSTSDSGISGGAIAGIVVGAVVLLISLLIAVYVILRRTRSRRHFASKTDVDIVTSDEEKHIPKTQELDGQAVGTQELDGYMRAELQTGELPLSELHETPIAELPASPVGAAKVSIKPADDEEGQSGSPTHWLNYQEKR